MISLFDILDIYDKIVHFIQMCWCNKTIIDQILYNQLLFENVFNNNLVALIAQVDTKSAHLLSEFWLQILLIKLKKQWIFLWSYLSLD